MTVLKLLSALEKRKVNSENKILTLFGLMVNFIISLSLLGYDISNTPVKLKVEP